MYGMEIYVIGFLAVFTIGIILRAVFVDEP